MGIWSWRTLPDESVEVDHGDGVGFFKPLSHEHPQVVDTQQRVMGWRELAAAAAAKHGVPLSWILAVVYAESGGQADADNAPACGGTGCVGLMAIHWKVHGQSRGDMLDPAKNLDYGTSLLAESRRRGYDLPAAASIHVAGGGTSYTPHSGTCSSAMVSPDFPGGSPWGMCEHMFPSAQGDGAVGYIDRVVRANNSFLELLGDSESPETPQPEPLPVPEEFGPLRAAPTAPAKGRWLALAAGGIVGYAAIERLTERLRRPHQPK